MTRDKFIQKTLKEDNKYLTGYVAFLDILGFKELYKNRTCEEIKAIFDDILLLKHDYNNEFGKIIASEQTIKNSTIKIVSDSIIVTTLDTLEGFEYLIYFCSFIQNMLLSCDLTLRGGIEYGEFYTMENTVFGTALTEAYKIENDIAVFPRIVISKNVIEHLKDTNIFRKSVMSDYANLKSNNSPAKIMIKKDFDDLYFVHYLNYLQNIKLANKIYLKQKIKEFIVSSMEKHKDKIKLFEKYYWLNKYYEVSIENNSMDNIMNFQKTEDNSNG